MSKQYLTQHTIDNAHPVDIFSLAVTQNQVLSASGASSIKINSTVDSDFSTVQVFNAAHKIGCHHVCTSADATKAASVGFGGECKIWTFTDGAWIEDGEVQDSKKAGEMWAITLSENGQYLASTTHDGRINVWDLLGERQKIREYETKGSFGLCVDLSLDGRFTASGHESGNVYIFNNDTGRMLHSLSGLVSRVRSVAFSPAGKLLAAAGDARVIALYDVSSGEQVGILKGHGAWITSLDFSHTGEYLLSGSFDGKVKVWSIDRQECVTTHSETDKGLWSVKWLPKTGRTEGFVTAGSNCSISFYREAAGS